jgi:hypothetical protein
VQQQETHLVAQPRQQLPRVGRQPRRRHARVRVHGAHAPAGAFDEHGLQSGAARRKGCGEQSARGAPRLRSRGGAGPPAGAHAAPQPPRAARTAGSNFSHASSTPPSAVRTPTDVPDASIAFTAYSTW